MQKCDKDSLNISCAGKKIDILRANYGRWSTEGCGGGTEVNCYSHKADTVVKSMCHLKDSCDIVVGPEIFDDPCKEIKKYLEVRYRCVEQ